MDLLNPFHLLFLWWVYNLGGQAKTLMFVQLNPDVESYFETISTLKFAERVSGVELGAARRNKEGRGLRELMEQVCIVSFRTYNFHCWAPAFGTLSSVLFSVIMFLCFINLMRQ